MKDDVALVILQIYQNSIKAHIVKSMLESHGIDAAVHEDTLSSVLPLNDSSRIGVRVMVREDDFEKASAILEQSNEIGDDYDVSGE